MQALDDELLGAIAERAIDPNVEVRYLAPRLRELEEEVAAEPAVPAPAAVADEWIDRKAVLPPTVIEQMQVTFALLASQRFGAQSLDERRSDRLDFHERSVWNIRTAVVEAYEKGWHAAPQSQATMWRGAWSRIRSAPLCTRPRDVARPVPCCRGRSGLALIILAGIRRARIRAAQAEQNPPAAGWC
ncbi:DUF6900 domain-containing protein [Roseateles sp.]|uniref:DUF6900 domain-containing protein n=1 Tax=Roseateles sp. TaxID=1971397 RepID=UPI0039C8DF66